MKILIIISLLAMMFTSCKLIKEIGDAPRSEYYIPNYYPYYHHYYSPSPYNWYPSYRMRPRMHGNEHRRRH